MSEKEQLEQALVLLEAQRAGLGDAVVDAAQAPLRAKLAALDNTPRQASGERKFVTVMFADIAGFTALAEMLDPEAARDLMNACFDCLVPVIQEYGGIVDKFMGDGVMALFGAPTAHENDPERALRAALAMRAALRDFNATRGLDLALHFGINTGLVIAGSLGAQGRQEYSVLGDAVNVAARLEDVSRSGEILVGPTTHRFTAPLFEFDALPPVSLKGKREPLAVYRLRALKAERGSLRGIAGMRAPLVGRAAPYTALQTALARLESGCGGTISLIGEAGLGKSRLLAEIRQNAPAHFLWLEGHCLSFGASIAYWPWLDILRALAGVAPDAPPAVLRDALHARLAQTCDARGASIYPYLARLLSLPLEEEVAAKVRGLDGETLKSATFQAIETLCTCLCAQQPVVIVGEDLHWGDPTSLALFERLLPLTHNAPLLLIGVLRPEHAHACWRFHEAASQNCSAHITLALEPLDAAQSAELVGHLLRVEDLPPALRDKILRHAEGNPFYVEEIIRSLLDAETIAYNEETSAWRATRDVATIEVPDTLQGVLMARIDRLQQETKHVLRLAAVIGRAFLYRVLAEIAREERALDTRLGELVQEQMIRERAREPELEYIFKHQLTQEAAYNGLLLQERRIYHRQVAKAIERLFPDRSDELAGLLAHHWEQAGDTEKAITCLTQAGQQAAAQYANLEAIDYLSRALALADAEDFENRVSLLRAREIVYNVIGDHAAQRGDLEALDAIAEATADARLRAYVTHRWANHYWGAGDLVKAHKTAQEAIQLAELADDLNIQAWGNFTLGRVMMYEARYESAQAPLQRALAFAQAAGNRFLEGWIVRNLGNLLSFLGKPTECQAYIEQALAIHREVGDRSGEAAALNTLALIYRSYNEPQKERETFEQALALYREFGMIFGQGMVLLNLGNSYSTWGDYAQAIMHFEEALALWQRSQGNPRMEGDLFNGLSGAYAGRNDYASAVACAEKALSMAQDYEYLRGQASALQSLSNLMVQQGHYTEAQTYLEQAARLSQELEDPFSIIGNQQIQARIYQTLGLYHLAEPLYPAIRQGCRDLNSESGESAVLTSWGWLKHNQQQHAEALVYAQQALDIARQIENPQNQSAALTIIGHVQAALGDWANAEAAYAEALRLVCALPEPGIAPADILAGLARVALQREDVAGALGHVEEMLSLKADSHFEGTGEPLRLYLTAYRVLVAAGDARAEALLTEAHALLQARAAAIEDAEQRRSYLENVPAHRELRALIQPD